MSEEIVAHAADWVHAVLEPRTAVSAGGISVTVIGVKA